MTTLDFGFLVGFSIDDILVLPVMPANLPPPQLSKLNYAPNSGVQFQTSVNAGNSYQFQVSSNLHDWVTLAHLVTFSNSINFFDPQATNQSARFYRVISP
jgi:hypothetical protein